MPTKRLLAVLSLVIAAAIVFVAAGCKPKRPTLNLFIWEEYMDPEVLKEFEAETGIHVVESNYGSNEDLLAKLQAGGGGYDVIVPSDYMVQEMRRQSLLAKIDPAKVPNLQKLHARFQKTPYDPGHEVSVPFQWGVTGIAYNADEISNPPKSWKEFFDPAFATPAKGRISMLNDSREVLGAALIALGHSPNSRNPAEIEAAKQLAGRFKPLVAKFDSESFEDSLAAGETILIQGWTGEITVAQGENDKLRYVLPADGTLMFVDNLAIPASSKNIDAAHQLIDFLLRPEIAARIADFTYYGTCVGPAWDLVDEKLRNGTPFIVPPEDRTYFLEDMGEFGAVYERAWTELKSQ